MSDGPTKQPRAKHDPALKAAVIAALLAGQGTTDIAAAYHIPKGTVQAWRAQTKGQLKSAQSVGSKREEIGDLIVEFLHTTLTTLCAQQQIMGDLKWLRQQSASDIAVLHGVLTDKAFRMLEALGGPNVAAESPAEPAGVA